MSDIELLMLAAKAAGILYNPTARSRRGLLAALNPADQGDTRYWNPLTDDGDLFRLAAALRFKVDFNTGEVRSPAGELLAVSDTDIGFAIVRAAANIGRGK